MTLRTDYILHFAISALLCVTLSRFIPVWFAAPVTLLVGIAKELIWDKALKKGTPEWMDILADVIGILFAFLLAL